MSDPHNTITKMLKHNNVCTQIVKKYGGIPIKEIKENNYDLSISKYREIEYGEVKYEKPDVIKKKIRDLENKIIEILKEIEVK